MADLNVTEITLKNIRETLNVHLATKHSFMLHGAPGVGKSQAIKDWCKENDYHLVTRMLSQMQPSDFIIPHVDKERNVTRWALADWLADIPKDRPSVVFLDELPAAPHDVQISAYQILLDRELAGFKLPEQCLVVAAGNRVTDGAISSDIGTAAADRLTHFNVTVDAEEWLEWAESKKVHPYILTFIKLNYHELLDEDNHDDLVRVSPRSWAVCSDYLYEAERQGISPKATQYLLEGRLGQTHTATFLQTMKEIKDLYEIKDYIAALKDTKNPNRLLKMAPNKTTAAYGLMFSLLNKAKEAEDFMNLLLIFLKFRGATDKTPNYEEIFVTCATIVGEKIVNSELAYEFINHPKFDDDLMNTLTGIPNFDELSLDQG